MMENKEKKIAGLKVKYNNSNYENITYFNISTWDGNENVSFTDKINNNTSTTVNCKFSDIKIIQE